MPQSENTNAPMSREKRWEIVRALLQRSDVSRQAKQAFRQAYPDAPEEMLQTAVFHNYVDGIGAAIDWLVSLELFLRDSSRKLDDRGETYHLLYHLYNWHQFQKLFRMEKQESWSASRTLES